MTSSRSRASINKLLALLVVFGVAFVPAIAGAGNRKRVVILDLQGPKAEKFHEDLVKLVKKQHTVVPTEKWNSTAEDLGADSLTDGNVKKVAKKLKIDAVVTGKIEKRRDEYIIQLKIRAGKTGAVTGQRIDTSSEGPRVDAKAATDLKDELVGAIASLRAGGGGDADEEEEEEERPKKKIAKKDEDEEEEEEEPKKKSSFGKKKSSDDEEEEEEEEEPKLSKKELAAKKKKEEEERRKAEAEERKAEEKRKKEELAAKREEDKRKKEEAKKKASKKSSDDEEEEEEEEDDTKAALKTKKDADSEDEEEEEEEEGSKKKVAARDGDEEDSGDVEASSDDGEVDESVNKLSVGERAVDAIVGLSFNARRMKFTYQSDLENHPPPYNGVPVAGLVLDVAVYPLAFSHKNKSMLKNIGLTFMYDKVLLINSKSDPDGPGGNAPVTLPTSQSRWAIGALFRYPVSKLLLVGGGIEYGTQSFSIKPSMGVSPGIPNTAYSAIAPNVFARLSFGKLIVGLDAAYLKIGKAGQIENADQYGPASKNGFEGSFSVDYMLKKFLFARVAFKAELIGFTFNGTGAMATNRDMDPEKDVFGASDRYFGGIATVGYLY